MDQAKKVAVELSQPSNPLPHHDLPVLIYTSDNQPPIHVVHTPRPHVAKTNYKRSAPESQSSSDPVQHNLIQGQPLVFPSSFNTAGTDVRAIKPLYASSYDGLAIPYGPRKQKRAAVNLPDGRVQTVTYTADHYGGFVADVKYEGESQYPPEKEYKPAPAPMYVP